MNQDLSKTDPTEVLNSSGTISSTTDFIMPSVEGVPSAEDAPQAPKKRPLKAVGPDGEPPSKKVSKPTIRLGAGFEWNLQALSLAANAVQSGGKSPVSALNELGVKVSYNIVRQGGPAHCPSFTIAVNVADMQFEGWGNSKREARAAAARACLQALLAKVGRTLPAATNQVTDFTSDDLPKEFESEDTTKEMPPLANVNQQAPFPNAPAAASNPEPLFGGPAPVGNVGKSPINLLYENYPGLSFLCTFGDGTSLDDAQGPPMTLSHSMRFKVVCVIKDSKFEGYGSSKKLAKLAAARSALAALYEALPPPAPGGPALPPPADRAPAGLLPQTLADHVAKLVNEKFNDIMKHDLVHSKRKVLAGIVITTDLSIKDARVIAVTTGTKCVSGEHISMRGMAVNDCHAEVVARRCLQRHLYQQLHMYAQAKDPRAPIEESDLEPLPTGGYRLKPSRHVHLYVSTAPCGDGRIFSPHETHALPDKHPNRAARGQLRTKIESGEGTIPVKNCSNVIQTWDGVLQGERLLTMSCSDKVARWCVLGLQGALLSLVLQPVYLHSLVLGSLLHPHHMYRALCGRIEGTLSSLPPLFALSRPQLARAASAEVRSPQRAPSHSVCWSRVQTEPEILNATTGKLESGRPSLLCKQTMFARWQHVIKKLQPLAQEQELEKAMALVHTQAENLLYSEAKQLCAPYQAAKHRMTEAFEKAQLGRWVKKPMEQDQFCCELKDCDPASLFA